MSKRIRRKGKTVQQLADEADQRKRNSLIAAGVPAAQVEGARVHDYETNLTHIRKPVTSIVDRWFAEGGPGFGEPQQRAVVHCLDLWEEAGGTGLLVANLDAIGGGIGGRERGRGQAEALTQLSLYRDKFGGYWGVFEDLVRWQQPAIVAGSDLADSHGKRIEKCRLVVGTVASCIATMRRY